MSPMRSRRRFASILPPASGWLMRGKFGFFAALLGLTTAASSAQAVTFSGSSGSLQASADFTIVSGNLQVVLKNTSTADVLIPADVLTAVFFDINGVSLTPVSASLGGSTVFFGPGGNVGGEWAYASGLSGAPGGAQKGISSSGLGLFGGANFGGANLQGPAGVDGLQYGITSAGDNTASGNAAVTGNFALIQSVVTFALSPDAALDLSKIKNVWFQYGTALTEPSFPDSSSQQQLPLPPALVLFGTALIGLTALGRRRRKA